MALPPGYEALVSMGDEVYSARHTLKQNSISPASMASPTGLLGRVVNGTVVFAREPRPASPALFDPQSLLGAPLPKVGLLTPQPGEDGSLVDHFLQSGVQGLVLEAFGAGNLPPLLARSLKNAMGKGIPVLIATRCPKGGVHPVYAYEGGAKDMQAAGAMLCGETTASKAALFLQMALACGFSKTRIINFFN